MRYFVVFHFYNTRLNSFNTFFLCSGGIIISLAFLERSSGASFGFTMLLAILFYINPLVASVSLGAIF